MPRWILIAAAALVLYLLVQGGDGAAQTSGASARRKRTVAQRQIPGPDQGGGAGSLFDSVSFARRGAVKVTANDPSDPAGGDFVTDDFGPVGGSWYDQGAPDTGATGDPDAAAQGLNDWAPPYVDQTDDASNDWSPPTADPNDGAPSGVSTLDFDWQAGIWGSPQADDNPVLRVSMGGALGDDAPVPADPYVAVAPADSADSSPDAQTDDVQWTALTDPQPDPAIDRNDVPDPWMAADDQAEVYA